MFEFRGIDLSTKYITPDTWEWLSDATFDYDAPLECVMYDHGCGILIWTYSADENDGSIPDDLRNIIRTAYELE